MSYRIYKSKYTGQEIDDLLGQVSSKVDDSMLGAAGGVATLDTSGKIPSQQMPENVAYTNKENTFTEPQSFNYVDSFDPNLSEYGEIGGSGANYSYTEYTDDTHKYSTSGEAYISSLVGRVMVGRSTIDEKGVSKNSIVLDVRKNWIARTETNEERVDGKLGTVVQTYYAYKFPKTYPNKEVTLATIEDLNAAITDLDKGHIAYVNKENTFTERQRIVTPYDSDINTQEEGFIDAGIINVSRIKYTDNTKQYYTDNDAALNARYLQLKQQIKNESGLTQHIIQLDHAGIKQVDYDNNSNTNYGYIFPKTYPNQNVTLATIEDLTAQLDTKFDKAGGTVTGDMVVGGNFTVQGKTTTVDSENLRVTDKLIEVGKGNTAPLTSPAGLITPKYDGTNNGGIVYDHTGTAYVGDISLDSNGNVDVNNSDLQPIATRNATITNGNLVKWDGTNHKLIDAGKNVDSFVDKLAASLRSQAYVRNANGEDSGLAYNYTDEGNTLALRNANGQVQVSTPLQDNDAANKKFVEDSLITTPITETETVVVDTTTVNFALDAEHDTGMYVSVENAISLGSTQLDWSSGRDKYKVIWDGVEYIVYGQSSTVTKLNNKLNNVDIPSGWYGWQLLGNGSNSKLMMYNKDTVNIPFAITQDRWKNSAEWLVYATTSTATTHTIKVIKIEGTYKKVTPEYQYGYVSMFNQNKNGLAVYGENAISDNVGGGIVSGYGNTIIADADSKGFTGDIIAQGSYVNVSSTNGEVSGANIEGSYNALYSSGTFYSPFLAGYKNLLKNNGVDWLSPFVTGYKNTIIANKGTIHPDAVFGSNHTITYDGNTTYGLNLVAGNGHTVKNAALSLITGLSNTVECLTADVYIHSNIVGGALNTVNHSRVIIGGNGNTSDRNNQFIAGTYSAANEKAIVKIGNGTKDAHANAFEVLDDNRAKVFGTPIENEDVVRKLELDNVNARYVSTSILGG